MPLLTAPWRRDPWPAARARRFCLVAIAILASVPAPSSAQGPRSHTGLYVALDVGRQQYIGGSLVSGVDLLQQATKPVGSVTLGARFERGFGTVVGLDIGFGFADGDLRMVDQAAALTVDYANDGQRQLGLTLGQAFGGAHRALVFVYLGEVTRQFNVTIQEGGVRYTQRDKQGLLRYGVGFQLDLVGPFSLRSTVGSSRADFGGRPTNITPGRTPGRPVEFSLGVAARAPGRRRAP